VFYDEVRRIIAASVAFFIVSIPICSAAWSADATLKTALESRYAAMKKAMAAHDGPAIAAILAPDFMSVDVTGQSETAAQMIAEVNGLKPDPNKSSATTLISIKQVANAVTNNGTI
jgi:hypothetical protein